MRLTVPDPQNLHVWFFLAAFGGAMLVLAWMEIVAGR